MGGQKFEILEDLALRSEMWNWNLEGVVNAQRAWFGSYKR